MKGRWCQVHRVVYWIYGTIISPLSMIVFILYPIPPRSPAHHLPSDLALGRPWGAEFNQRDRDPSAFSFDGQSNKAGSSMTHQSARVRARGEHQRQLLLLLRWGENSHFRTPAQQRLADLCPRTAALAEVIWPGIVALINSKDDNRDVVIVWPPITDKKFSQLEMEVSSGLGRSS